MIRILYAWELGGGFGHVQRMKTFMQLLPSGSYEMLYAGRPVPPEFAITNYLDVSPGPMPVHAGGGNRQPSINFADLLLAAGLCDKNFIEIITSYWETAISSGSPDLVLADHAPFAILTSRLLGIPVIATGSPFTVAPQQEIMPSLLPWTRIPQRKLRDASQEANSIVQGVLGREVRVRDLYSEAIITSPAKMDYFPNRFGAFYCQKPYSQFSLTPSAALKATRAAQPLLVYLRDYPRRFLGVCEQLIRKYRLPVIVQTTDATVAEKLHKRGIGTTTPSSYQSVLLEGCSAVVSHGGINTIDENWSLGYPSILFPRSVEQALNTRRAIQLRIGEVWPNYEDHEMEADQLIRIISTYCPREAYPAVPDVSSLGKSLLSHLKGVC